MEEKTSLLVMAPGRCIYGGRMEQNVMVVMPARVKITANQKSPFLIEYL